MSFLTKLQFTTVTRITERNLTQERRDKFITGADAQRAAIAAVLNGQTLTMPAKKKADAVPRERAVRAWFFQKDGGWYLQPRYGARALLVDGKSNAIFAAKLADVDAALTALIEAAKSGELDPVLELASRRGNRSAV